MIKLYSPSDEIELAMLKSLLEAADVPFYVHNDHFGALYIGPQIQLYNRRMFMVAPEYAEAAKGVLADYLANQETSPEHPEAQEQKASVWDKVRMTMEALLFAWIVPRKRRSKNRDLED